MKTIEMFIGGVRVAGEGTLPVYHKATGEVIAEIAAAGAEHVRAAVDAAERAFHEVQLSPYERYEIIMRAANLMKERREEFAEALSAEAGKPIRDARGEIDRAYQTLILSAEEAKRLRGETVPLAGAPGCERRMAFTIRRPLGVVCAITPFNFPVNLAAHKIGPALAAGNTVIYKPASATPLTASLLVEVFQEAGLPAGCLNLIYGAGSAVGRLLTADERIRMFSFTGSVPVGKTLHEAVGFRRIALELGSNSANIVHEDVADVAWVAEHCARHAFVNAGQVCISCQRVYVARAIYEEFCAAAVEAAQNFKSGDLMDVHTQIGSMISEREAERIEAWVDEAAAAGAHLLAGGHRTGAFYEPTVLTDVTPAMKVVSEETFAPVFSIIPYDTIEDAVRMVNDTRYGLQAGVFTRSLAVANYCAEHLDVGGVVIGDGATFRMDNMPYGGVKDSGIGREGPAYAIRELTEEKLIVLNVEG
ncbi:aldehyde dehydrogenase family protein [Selenomonas timonae]|uniref:Aldehyde dehydrogenase family protein n=1 Tax=Selenomonas timonae TaxID=2754044 RepID=A0A7G7VKY0_9FIRM|nr:aldehyde dehydrogenase family protein [Selenomonas timonae]QNH54773.1 aldehyde dehydrogenase family protein [Selenomonas timonae]